MHDDKTVISPDTQRKTRIPPGQRLASDFPVLHYGTMPDMDITKWKFSITGLVARERTLSYDEFMSLPKINVHADIHCVTGWSKLDTYWEGVDTSILKELVKIKPEAKFVMVHAAKGFTTNLSLADFFQNDVVFATRFNGKVLSLDHGFPVRLVVPRVYFWKSAKWVTGVEFMEQEQLGFWESHGYHRHGDPWKEERYG